MGELIVYPFGQRPKAVVSKKRLGQLLGRSVRWIELRTAEGAPSSLSGRRRRYHLREFREWLEANGHSELAAKLERLPDKPVNHGPPADPYIAGLEGEVRELRDRVVRLEGPAGWCGPAA